MAAMLRACVLWCAARSAASRDWPVWRSLDDVPTEGAHGRLAANWAVTGGACEAERAFLESAMVARSGAILEGDLARAVGVDRADLISRPG